jgi:hypothetical protein
MCHGYAGFGAGKRYKWLIDKPLETPSPDWTLAGLELVHRIRKRQFKFGPGWWSRWSLKKQWDVGLA